MKRNVLVIRVVSCLFPGAVSFYSSSRRPLRTASHRRVASFLRASLIRIRWRDARSLSKENLFHSLINNVLNFSFQGLVTLSILRFCARCRVLYDMIAVIVLVEYRFLEMYSIDIFNYRQSNLDCSETIFLEHRARFSCGRERKG